MLPSSGFWVLLCLIVLAPLVFDRISESRKLPPEKNASEASTKNVATSDSDPRKLVALDNYYNSDLKSDWMASGMQDRNLHDLPSGINNFQEVPFRVGGLIQLRGKILAQRCPWFPEAIRGIPIQAKCSSLHFLHGTAWSVADDVEIGAYIIHFSDSTQIRYPILYGKDVRDWSFNQADPDQTNNTAWSSKREPTSLRLYSSSWQNPKPDVAVESIDYFSEDTECAPFLIAITCE